MIVNVVGTKRREVVICLKIVLPQFRRAATIFNTAPNPCDTCGFRD